ncbi:MAG: HEPN domain-containing protein [Moraxellaceae bacterium]|nr:HEPN domain-containing protein [Moraxellaceae bacterium]
MNAQLIKKIADQLKSVAEGVLPLGKESEFLGFKMHDGVAYSLTSEAAITFNDVVSKLLCQKQFSKKFSSIYIEKKLKTIFAELLSNPECDIEKKISDLGEELSNFNHSNIVFLKIEGIVLSACLIIGRVRFVPGDEYLIQNINDKSSAIIKTSKNDEESKKILQEFIEKQSRDELQGGCVGVVEVNAEPERAFEYAKEEVRRAIDLLRFSTKATYPLSEDIRIGLKGDHPKNQRQGFIASESGFNTRGDSVGSVRPFEINENTIRRMDEIGIFLVSDALSKTQTNSLEEAIIRAIHWFSVALTQNDSSNAFLFLIVALESLFKAEMGNSIGGTVAESVAFIMADNLEGRKQLISIVRNYYGKRSGVAHGGNKSISDLELLTLTNIVSTAIMIIIKKLNKFSSQKELMGWIEEMKLK